MAEQHCERTLQACQANLRRVGLEFILIMTDRSELEYQQDPHWVVIPLTCSELGTVKSGSQLSFFGYENRTG